MNTTPPLLLEFEPTNGCNLRCEICPHGSPDEKNFPFYPKHKIKNMTFKEFKKILDSYDYKPIPRIQFCGTGEPLLNPELMDMINYAKSLGDNVELITNGTLLTQENIEKLKNTKLNLIRISIDGPNEESYQRIRKYPLKKVAEKVKSLTNQTKIPVMVNCVVTKDNLNDLIDMPKFLHSIGATILELRLFDGGSAKMEFSIYEKNKIKELYENIAKECKKLKIKFIPWQPTEYLNQDCLFNFEANINFEGYLTPCFNTPRIRIGEKLGTKPFSKIWNGKEAKKIRDELNNEVFTDDCKCIRTVNKI